MPGPGVEPHLFVVLGGTGDLMRRKLLPAIYSLTAKGLLGDRCHILAVARKTEVSDDGFRSWARDALAASGHSTDDLGGRWCSQCLHYQPLGQGTPDDYRALAARIASLETEHDLPGNRAFYLALPPAAFPAAVSGLGQAGLNRAPGRVRLVVEKPFGHDLASAQELSRLVHRHFDESQTYRIDHYLGKETVQNLLVFRFANAIFESLWNRERVQSVHITVAESVGVGQRGDYYDEVGALRDMVQNHLTQLLALTAMEIPPAFEADAIRDEKAKVLRSLEPITPDDVVFGQYASGQLNGEKVAGYLEEPGVAPDSATETFVALRLRIANWRWQGVPFYLRTGKRLPRRLTQIAVTFRATPLALFRAFEGCQVHSNVLVITLQPDEGFDLAFEVKSPGQPFDIQTQRLDFRYAEAFAPVPQAYETLLLDILTGDQTLFVRADEIEAAWRLYTPLLEQRLPVHPYAAGTWGPEAAHRLLALDTRGG
ncbi:MAG: glucose-6-phosphate dehydrogenase, partial [Armatimonadota bacterium]